MQFKLDLIRKDNDFTNVSEGIKSHAIDIYKQNILELINENLDVLRLFEHCKKPDIKYLKINENDSISDNDCIYKINDINDIKYLSAIEILVHSFEKCSLITYWNQPINKFNIYISCKKPIKNRQFEKFRFDINSYSNYKEIYNFTINYYSWIKTIIKVARQLLKIAIYPEFENAKEIYKNYYKNCFLQQK